MSTSSNRNGLPLILSINIICLIFIKSILQMTHITVPTIMKDFQFISDFKDTPLYRFRAYTLWSMVSVVYWSYSLLAFFRYVRVVYPTKFWLHGSSLYLYGLIPGHYICVLISLLPLIFIFDSIQQIPDEVYCSILTTPFYSLIYATCFTFLIPVSCMVVFYVGIIRKIRETASIRQDQELYQRDYTVIKRMLWNLFLLNIVTLLTAIVYIISILRNDIWSTFHRIEWLTSSVCSCLFALILPLITKRLHDFLRPNRLGPMNNPNVM